MTQQVRLRPKLIADVIYEHAPNTEPVVFETGPLSVWFCHAMSAESVPAICIDPRHVEVVLNTAPNKTDAGELAYLAEVGLYREVRVKASIGCRFAFERPRLAAVVRIYWSGHT